MKRSMPLLAALTLFSFNAWADNAWYVDGSAGMTYAAEKGWPSDKTFATIKEALAKVTRGDVIDNIHVAPGDYHEPILSSSQHRIYLYAAEEDPSLTRLIGSGGSSDSSAQDSLVFSSSLTAIAGFTFENYVSKSASDACVKAGVFSNCVFSSCNVSGNYLFQVNDTAFNVQVRDCEMTGSPFAKMEGNPKTYTGIVFSNNVFKCSVDNKKAFVSIHVNGVFVDCAFIDNRAEATAEDAQIGDLNVYCFSSASRLNGGDFQGNQALSVQANYASNCVFRACTAYGVPLLKCSPAGNVRVTDCRVVDESLLSMEGSSAIYTDCLISNNTVDCSLALNLVGIVKSHSSGSFIRFRLIDNRVNSTAASVGAYSVSACFTTAAKTYDSLYVNNIATSAMEPTSTLYPISGKIGNTISNCMIVACTTPLPGSAVHHSVVSNCTGALLIQGDTSRVYNSLFVNNTKTHELYGLNARSFQGYYYNCTFVGNRFDNTASGATGVNGRYYNCIFNGNTPYDIGSLNGDFKNSLYGTKANSNSDSKIVDCIKTDNPKFNLGAKPELPYYALRRGSPAIDKGAATLNNNLTWEFDLAGNPRIYQPEGGNATPIDIGCYEWFPTNDGFVLILR